MVLDAGGQRNVFGAQAMLDNLSTNGFYLRLARTVARGERLLVVVQVSQALVALRGTVLRAEPQKDGCGLAVAVAQYRIFSLLEVNKSVRR